jgi:hypothetical protein
VASRAPLRAAGPQGQALGRMLMAARRLWARVVRQPMSA